MTVGLPVWSTTASANATIDTLISVPEGMAPSAVNDQMRNTMASLKRWYDDLIGATTSLSTGGTSTAYTASTNCGYSNSTAMNGAIFTVIPHATNGAGATINVDGLGAKTLATVDGSTAV